jgi:hypothetical protein
MCVLVVDGGLCALYRHQCVNLRFVAIMHGIVKILHRHSFLAPFFCFISAFTCNSGKLHGLTLRCAPHALICKKELVICHGINRQWYPSFSRASSHNLSFEGAPLSHTVTKDLVEVRVLKTLLILQQPKQH